MNEHTCLVCGYDGDLEFYPRDHMICGCCGTEFGYDDRVLTNEQLRGIWIAADCPWFDEDEPKPAGWSPQTQMERAGLLPQSAPLARRTYTISVPVHLVAEWNVRRSYQAPESDEEDVYTESVHNPVVIGELVTAG